MSLILAINPGINSSIGIFQNGEPLFCVQEERFNRIKNWMGFPYEALKYVIGEKIINPEEVDYIGIPNSFYLGMDRTAFYESYKNDFYWSSKRDINLRSVRDYIGNNIISRKKIMTSLNKLTGKKNEFVDGEIKYLISLGFREEKIKRLDHHYCHAAAVYYGLARSLEQQYLVFTLDGGGDYKTASISISGNGKLENVSTCSCFSIGNMYSSITHWLGFTAHEHEYKIMGLAPYVNEKYRDKYLEYFRKFLTLKDRNTKFDNPVPLTRERFFRHIRNDLPQDRFDNIAAGLQAFTEEIVVKWVKGGINKYGIKNILCSGGVFMNVKVNMLLSKLPEVEFIDVFPSCGDESNVFGAGFHLYNNYVERKIGCLNSYCLGTTAGADLEKGIEKYSESIECERYDGDINKFIADQLIKNKIVARCSGKMEFGARALGNRSILANPTDLTTVNKINRAIKNRDFWMPFAPAINWDKAEELLNIPSSLRNHGSPYMMFAFHVKKEKQQDIVCTIHQADHTARAQTVTKERYPDLYRIIDFFYRETKIPCLLNTSFNLHGFPIVENSDQAIDVLLKSKLDLLVIDNYIIRRK